MEGQTVGTIKVFTIDDLPDELLLFVFSRFADPVTLFRISHVCKKWRKLAAHRFLLPNRIQIMASPSSQTLLKSVSPLRSGTKQGSPPFSAGQSLNSSSPSVFTLSTSAPSKVFSLSTNQRSRPPSISSSGSSPFRLSSSIVFSPKDFKATVEPSNLPRRTFTSPIQHNKEIVDTIKLQLAPNSEGVCKSCLILQPLLSSSEKREFGSSSINRSPRSVVFRIQILKFQVLRFSENSVHCGCYFIEKSEPKRQLYCRFSCVTGLNSVDCDLGKECGPKVVGGDDDDDLDQQRPWDGISLTITSIDLQGDDVCEVVFCLLDDKERVKRIRNEMKYEAELSSSTSSLTDVQTSVTFSEQTTQREEECYNAAEAPRKFTLQYFLRALLFPWKILPPSQTPSRSSYDDSTEEIQIPATIITPSSPMPIQVSSMKLDRSTVASSNFCYTTVNTRCCVLPFMTSLSTSSN